jgi:hypothetical protein
MSTAPTPGPKKIDVGTEKAIFKVLVEQGKKHVTTLTAWRQDLEDFLNTGDIGAAATANAELQTNAAPDMQRLSEIAGHLELVNNWIEANARNFAADWNNEMTTGGPSAADVMTEFHAQLREAIGIIAARACWGIARDSQPSVASRLRSLLGTATQLRGLPLGNAGTSRQVLQTVHSAIGEATLAMEQEANRRPASVSASAAGRTVKGATAERYLEYRSNLGRALTLVGRHEFWDRADLSIESPTVGSLARQLAADLDTRIVLVPGGGANEIQVTDPNAILVALKRLIERMERECEMRYPDGVEMQRGTSAEKQHRNNIFWWRTKVYGSIATLLALTGGAYMLSGKSETKQTDTKPGPPPALVTPAVRTPTTLATAPAPALTEFPVAEGCTVERKGADLIFVVPAGRNAANVFVSTGGGAKVQIGTNLREGSHKLTLPLAMQGGAVDMHAQVYNGTDWVRAPDINLP